MIIYPYAIEFTIPGTPQQQGSKNQGRNGHMYDANKNLKPWRGYAVHEARLAKPKRAGDGFVWDAGVPVTVEAFFLFTRPASHYGTGRNAHTLKPAAPIYKPSKPDLDKLQRALGDALTIAGIIKDDSQIVTWYPRKLWTSEPAATEVKVWAAETSA